MMIEKIIGAKFNSIFRAADMLCLNLGKDIKDLYGDTVSEYSFHIQTQWRFIKENEIILASGDIYTPYNPDIDGDEWDYDVFDRANDESSIFDVVQKSFGENFVNATVAETMVNPIGDLRITFSNGIVFETFTPSTRKDEFWRFISFYENRDSEHFVCFS